MASPRIIESEIDIVNRSTNKIQDNKTGIAKQTHAISANSKLIQRLLAEYAFDLLLKGLN